KAQHCGNPVRAALAATAPPSERYAQRSGPLRLLVVGGSLGAQALNEIVPQALARLDPAQRPRVTHQSGSRHGAALAAAYRDAGVEARQVEFIEDMAAAYADADLVICRAGAMTVAEVACVGVAALFVPYPHAVDDHQTTNARFLTERGAALMTPQRDLSAGSLARQLAALTREQLLEIAVRARALGKPGAADCVADACEAIAKD
ncbi:MAG TPA: glycosyltransferase, partial [Burkholderiaceae bacterium]|nr:glycosyltransferase [Burkholderiaceae bacterium]